MIQKVIEHSARSISFSADELKPWTEEDEQLIDVYIKLHDRENQLKQQAQELLAACSSLDKLTEETRKSLVALKKDITELSKLADGFMIVDPARQQKADRITEQTERINEKIQAYQSSLSEPASEAAGCATLNSALINDIENFDLWDDYDNTRSEHSANYDINSIDVVSFDQDDEFFRGFIAVRSESNKSAIDYANSTIDNYSKLMLETEVQYGIWDQFLKRLALIRSIAESKSGELFTSSN